MLATAPVWFSHGSDLLYVPTEYVWVLVCLALRGAGVSVLSWIESHTRSLGLYPNGCISYRFRYERERNPEQRVSAKGF